ncbi:MAG: hypothetical protein F4Z20_00355 [Gammaproteobacteria bacterium]|nr:hypothetical protein [Gammaproteobacteria bacterium]
MIALTRPPSMPIPAQSSIRTCSPLPHWRTGKSAAVEPPAIRALANSTTALQSRAIPVLPPGLSTNRPFEQPSASISRGAVTIRSGGPSRIGGIAENTAPFSGIPIVATGPEQVACTEYAPSSSEPSNSSSTNRNSTEFEGTVSRTMSSTESR